MSKTMRRHNNIYHMSGFNLIDILIAIAVAGIGIMGITQLQRVTIQAENAAKSRITAIEVLAKKLVQLHHTPFALLSSNQDSLIVRHHTYSRKWIVTDRYLINNSWENSNLLLANKPTLAHEKLVTMRVTWTDSNNKQQSITQHGYLSPQAMLNHIPTHNNVGKQLTVSDIEE